MKARIYRSFDPSKPSASPQSLRRNQAAANLWVISISVFRDSTIYMSCFLYVISIRNRNRSEDSTGRSGIEFLKLPVSVSQYFNSGNFVTPGAVSSLLSESVLPGSCS